MRLRTIMLPAVAAAAMAIPAARGAEPSGRYLDRPMPEAWSYDSHFNQDIPDDDHWWTYFNDAVLDSLIARGVQANYNLLEAEHRINIARQAVNNARAAWYPTLGFSGGWTKNRASGANGPVMGEAATSSLFSLGLNASWEADIFGRIHSRVKQQKAAWRASRAEYAGALTALCANIAKTYVTLRVYQAELEVAREHIATQQKVVRITEARHEAGLASQLDIQQAKSVFYSTQASMPMLENSIHSSIYALATLVGQYPDSLYTLLGEPGRIPDHTQIVPLGVPAELLRRRPDIAQAEQEVAGYAAALGISKKEFLPTLTINGSIGTQAHKGGDLFKNPSLTYSIAPTLSWTLFDGMARRSNLISAREQLQAGIEAYNLTVMTAVQEVDNSVSTYIATLKKIGFLKEVVDSRRETLTLSLDLYKRGLNPFTDVMNAQMNLLADQNSMIEARGSALTALIALYEALGGGWDGAQLPK